MFSFITLEITEREKITAKQQNILFKLKELGFKLAIDDFGTGYSSLSYLSEMNVDILKIDISFIRKISNDSKALKLVEAIIALYKALGIKTVAEGVETTNELNILRSLGCDYYQGYYFSPPLFCEDFKKFLI